MPTLSLKRLAAALVLPLIIAGCAAEPGPMPVNETFYANIAKGGSLDPQAAAALLSDYRQARGLPAVTIDPTLMAVAERQAKGMAAADELSHSVGGRSLTARLKSAGFSGLKASENVGAGYQTLAEAFSGWRDSPPHNKNMLMPGATKLGVAAVRAPRSKYRVYWAMVLGVPDPKVEAAQQATAPAGAPAAGDTQVLLNGAQLPQ